jgi:hypothetical protein
MRYYYLLQQNPCSLNLVTIIPIILKPIMKIITNQSLYKLLTVLRSLRFPDFQTVGTWWQVCQPYAPAGFILQEIFLVLISTGIKFRWGRVLQIGPGAHPASNTESTGLSGGGGGVNGLGVALTTHPI